MSFWGHKHLSGLQSFSVRQLAVGLERTVRSHYTDKSITQKFCFCCFFFSFSSLNTHTFTINSKALCHLELGGPCFKQKATVLCISVVLGFQINFCHLAFSPEYSSGFYFQCLDLKSFTQDTGTQNCWKFQRWKVSDLQKGLLNDG